MSCCDTCPFAFTDASETVQNYGCLPSPYEIVTMRTVHGKTWACHCDVSKPCIGALEILKQQGLDNKIIDAQLIDESVNWAALTQTPT